MTYSVEKIMSISRGEFEASLAGLDHTAKLSVAGCARVTCAGVTAGIQFQALPARVLGGLLALPQASVRITIDHASDAKIADFLRGFDIAFQRGGG